MNISIRLILTIILLNIAGISMAQQWTKELILSPAFMGPNALPVPEIKTGTYDTLISLETAYDYHYNTGDQTQNIFNRLYIPITPGKVGIEVTMVPVEYFVMNEETVEARHLFHKDLKGYHSGDFYISTYWQVLQNHHYLPDILLSINIKTASGFGIESARHTDTPGYYFDISTGKNINLCSNIVIRPFALLGFYCYQTYEYNHFQNDALMYGFGILGRIKDIEINNLIGGYAGYMNNGDQPLVYRASIQSRFSKMFNFKIQYQHGLIDFPYRSARFSVLYHF